MGPQRAALEVRGATEDTQVGLGVAGVLVTGQGGNGSDRRAKAAA